MADNIDKVKIRTGEDGPSVMVPALVTEKDDGLVRCRKCGAEMGRKVRRNGRVMIKIGSFVYYRLHGWCDVCNQQRHWEGQNGSKKYFTKGEKDV